MHMKDDDKWIFMEQAISITNMLHEDIKFADAEYLNRYKVGQSLEEVDLTRTFDWEYFLKNPTDPVVKKALSYLLNSFDIIPPDDEINDIELSVGGFADNLKQNMTSINKHVKERELSPEFVIAWGNFRAADILLHFILHDLASQQFDRAHKGESIKPNQYWYALWIDDMKKKSPNLMRKDADLTLAKILLGIVKKERVIPPHLNQEWFLPWVTKILSTDKKTKIIKDRLSTGYLAREIRNKSFDDFLIEAKEFEHFLPPVGEFYYPLQ